MPRSGLFGLGISPFRARRYSARRVSRAGRVRRSDIRVHRGRRRGVAEPCPDFAGSDAAGPRCAAARVARFAAGNDLCRAPVPICGADGLGALRPGAVVGSALVERGRGRHERSALAVEAVRRRPLRADRLLGRGRYRRPARGAARRCGYADYHRRAARRDGVDRASRRFAAFRFARPRRGARRPARPRPAFPRRPRRRGTAIGYRGIPPRRAPERALLDDSRVRSPLLLGARLAPNSPRRRHRWR